MTSQSRKHRKKIEDTSRMGGNRLGPPKERLAQRLRYIPETGCMEYEGARITTGYGYMTIEGTTRYAHRLAFEIANDRLLVPGEVVCHRCDNPPCCNPDHLFAGTIADNNRDMWAKGRGKLTPPAWRKIPLDELPKIIERFTSGEAKRDIAADYDVSRQAIHYLLRREGVA